MDPGLRPTTDTDRQRVSEFIIAHWGSQYVVTRGRVHLPELLPGFVVESEGRITGLLTYRYDGDAIEIISLNSLNTGKGIGSALIRAVIGTAGHKGIRRVWLITTNDNLNAIGFYQKRGFYLTAVHRNAVTRSRELKPEIPETGMDGIPIRDEIEMEILLS